MTNDNISTLSSTVFNNSVNNTSLLFPCKNYLVLKESNQINPNVILFDNAASGLSIAQLFFGLISNSLAIVVFNKCSFRRTSSTLILGATAVVDTITIILVAILSILLSFSSITVVNNAAWLCTLMPCLTRFLIALAASSVGILSLERIVAFISRCCKSNNVLLGRRGTLIFLVVTYSLVLACHVPCIVWSQYDYANQRCIPWKTVHSWILLWVDLALQNILPAFCSLLFFFVLFAMKLCVAYTDVKSPMDKWATTLSMCAQGVYLGASLPHLIYTIFLVYNERYYEIQSCLEEDYVSKITIYSLLVNVFNLHMVLKPAFYIFCSRYRRELLGTICTNPNFRPKQPRDSVMVAQRHGV